MNLFAMKLLFAELSVPGPDLLLRDYGRRAFPILEEALLKVQSGQALSLDFDEVSVLDTSFADETVVELAVRLVDGQYGDRFLILLNPSAATVDNLEGTIARRKAKVALPIRDGDHMRVIGHVEPNLAEAWDLTLRKGELTARSLADRLSLQINTASMRLRKLYEARLLTRREETISTGRHHVYEILK
jgi:DNA-binding transcriptional ArsR family regulator